MSYLISFNRSKAVSNGYNNVYRHEFPMSSVNLKDAEVAVHSISMYNSVFNIDSTAYGNNTVSVIMPTAGTTSNVSIVFDDGLYSYQDMTRYIQSKLKAAGAYLIDSDGNEVYYIQISENPTYYAAQVDCSPLPTSLPSGWTRPATGLYSTLGTGLPLTTRVPILTITNQPFGDLIGFSAGNYPPTATTTLQSFLSNKTPQIHPVSSYVLRCSIINNPFNLPSDILTTFDTQGTSAGQLISYKPNELAWVPISDGAYPSITLTIVDQDERFVRIRDASVLITLAIRQKK
jgi:hypothetical protein